MKPSLCLGVTNQLAQDHGQRPLKEASMTNGLNGCRKWMLSCSFALVPLRKASTSIEGAKASNRNGCLCP
eukprot:9066793-Prorocentrum_lima.AAC.1